jgi:hypothetical protein
LRKASPYNPPGFDFIRWHWGFSTVIYFMQAVSSGSIKIGYTASPERRLQDIGQLSSEPIKILATMEGDRDLEHSLHVRFVANRIRGEWFSPTEELLAFVRENAKPWIPYPISICNGWTPALKIGPDWKPEGPGLCPDADHWGIPTLDLSWQATRDDLVSLRGWFKWGSTSKTRPGKAKGRGVHFYEYDHHWSALWKHPDRLIRFGPSVAVEANYSTFPELPRAAALYNIYRKRTLSSYWGKGGVKLLVDVNLDPSFTDLALVGVPRGWSAYSTRSHRDLGPQKLIEDYELVAEHAQAGDSPDPVTFIVFGGGQAIRHLCEEKKWAWVPEQIRTAHGTAAEAILPEMN